MLKKLFFLLGFIISGLYGTAQDIHFSQFFISPLSLNPATTGAFDGDYRVSGIYRDQWRSVTVPYQTIAFSADARNFANTENFGLGINVFYDQAGDSHFSTLQANFSMAWTFFLDKRRKTEYLNVGVLGSLTQKAFNLDKLRFDSQYIPVNGGSYYFDPNQPSFEGMSDYSIFYPDLSIGLYYHWQPKKRKMVNAGISVANITRPNQSFLSTEQVSLDRRYTFHAEGLFKVSDRVDAIPQILMMKQGTFYQITPGVMGKYILRSDRRRYQALYAGIYTRARDAAFVTVGMDYNKWYFGLSYDLNYSKLVPASRGRGGFEIAVSYIIDKLPARKKYNACPDFM